MDTCTIEVGLLKKKPCGQNAVTKCGNCEQPLCAKHATAMMSGGKKTMLCAECAKAWKDMGEVPSTPAAAPAAKKPAEGPKAAAPAHAPAPTPAAAAPKPAPPAPKPAPTPAAAGKKPDLSIEHSGSMDFKPAAGAAPKPAPAAPKPAAAAPKAEDSGLDKKPDLSIDMTGPLEFTPSKKPDDKK